MYKLYTIPGSCSTGIHTLLIELGVPYETINRDSIEDYQKLVATNQVPALQTADKILTEGAAICFYLLQKYGDKKLLANQDFLQALLFNYATLHPAYSKLFAAMQMEGGQAKQAYMEKLADRVADFWQIVDKQLEGKSFSYNETPTVIDYLLTIYVRWGNVFPELNIPVGNNVLALVERVIKLPQFQQAFKTENIEYNLPKNALSA